MANYLKYNYFWDCDSIDNVTLRLWKFSDFCSRHTVGVAGDDIMFHILVINDDTDKCWCIHVYNSILNNKDNFYGPMYTFDVKSVFF